VYLLLRELDVSHDDDVHPTNLEKQFPQCFHNWGGEGALPITTSECTVETLGLLGL